MASSPATVDLVSRKPRYARAADKLRKRVAAARPGEKLSEAGLAREFGVSRSLLRMSVTDLVNEGLLVRAPGRGTFVTEKVLETHSVRVCFGGNVEYAAADRAAERALQVHFPNARVLRMPRQGEVDVRTVISHAVPRLARQFQSLDFVLERYPDLAPEAFLPEGRRLFEHEGRLIALPLLFSPAVLHYNPIRFEEAGISPPDDTWTWEDMIEAARALHNPEQNRFGVSLPQKIRLFITMVWSMGGEVTDHESGLWNLRHDAAYRAAVVFARLAECAAPVPSSRGRFRSAGEVADPRAAMILSGGVLPTQMESRAPGWIRTAPMPRGLRRATWILAEGVGLAKECVNPDLAAAYIHELAGPVGQQALLDAALRIP